MVQKISKTALRVGGQFNKEVSISERRDIQVAIYRQSVDPAWETFLAQQPDGCYQQSRLWAKIKASEGWQSVCLVLKQDDSVLGGAQIFLRSVSKLGQVGYVSKGPLVADDDPALAEILLDELHRLTRAERIRFLKLQPPKGADAMASALQTRGAQPSDIPVTPLSTIRIDLSQSPEDIKAEMHRRTRQNIGRAERKGVSVRLGRREDIPDLIKISHLHAEQHNYGASPPEYYYRLWDTLAEAGHFVFFVAYFKGEPIAARSNLAFGDVLFAQYLVDDGEHRRLNAPTLLHWRAMRWGQENGCRWYDFGGIKIYLARILLAGDDLPDTVEGRRTKFKLSFGGDVVLRSGAYDLAYVGPQKLTSRLVPLAMQAGPVLAALLGPRLAGYLQMHQRSVSQGAGVEEEEGE